MAGGLGFSGTIGPAFTAGWPGWPGRAPATGVSMRAGADWAEKMFLPVPMYSTCSLSASLSRCRAGSMSALEIFWASGPLEVAGFAAVAWPLAGAAWGPEGCDAAGTVRAGVGALLKKISLIS